MDNLIPVIDHALVRRRFERAAPTHARAAVLFREVERRMLERLAYVKVAPARIIDAGCGQGEGLRELARLYPKAQLLGVDVAQPMLDAFRAPGLLERARALFGAAAPRTLCADMRAIPVADASAGLVWSNCALQSLGDPAAALRELGRVTEPGGLLMFSTFGPDTLKELRSAFAAVDDAPHVHPFIDMHDLGDMLAAAGFSAPVMDMEIITLTYADVPALVRDLRDTGQLNALESRRRTLTGPCRWRRMLEAYEQERRDGRLPASFEVVYGHAWKGAPRKAPGPAVVKLDFPRRRGS